MNNRKMLLGVAALLASAQALADITFYEGEDFRGRAFTTEQQSADFRRSGFNDRASSVIVDSGRWEVCEDSGFRGQCVILREGSYDSLKRMGVNNQVSSARRISGNGNARYNGYAEPEPLPYATYEYRRRPNERVYEARVTSVRAVMGEPERRCWVDREVVERRGNPNVAGGIIGGVIGGILGHEIGGKGIATAGGAVAGAAVGANANRGRDDYSRDVQRCETTMNGAPDYWDVRYQYRGVEHRVQMSAAPGRNIYVNRNGEPRQ
ncbi:MAG: beta/gamma crystallin family protein [Pseudomonadota bacterium]